MDGLNKFTTRSHLHVNNGCAGGATCFHSSADINEEADLIVVHFAFVFFFLVQKVLQEQLASPDTTSEATGASLLHQVGH